MVKAGTVLAFFRTIVPILVVPVDVGPYLVDGFVLVLIDVGVFYQRLDVRIALGECRAHLVVLGA